MDQDYTNQLRLFVAQMYGIHLSISEQIILMVTLMVASKVYRVPGVSIVVLLTTLELWASKTRARVNYR